jgi:SAM-dependent methyltransferase
LCAGSIPAGGTTGPPARPAGSPAPPSRGCSGYGETAAAGYASVRRPDPRIAQRIEAALAGAGSVVNVGAGTGSYEPAGVRLVAVEPSAAMVARRPPGSAPAVRAAAEALPFPAGSFDAALAVLTVHHWDHPAGGVAELRRVARRQVVLGYDPRRAGDLWFVREYLPEVATLLAGGPALESLAGWLGDVAIESVPIPGDCTDGFLGAWWRRPHAYLDPAVRAGISVFPQLEPGVVGRALDALDRDLRSGVWARRHAALLARDDLDLGYRLLVSG